MGKIYITGMGAVAAPGINTDLIMEALYAGNRKTVCPASRLELYTAEKKPVFEVDSDLEDYPPEETRTVRLLQTASAEALASAGLTYTDLRKKRVGICVGTTITTCTEVKNEEFYRQFREGHLQGPVVRESNRNSNPAVYLAEKWGLTQPLTAVITNACSSGTDALGLARFWLDSGFCDIVLAGGADELSRISYLGFNSLQIYSPEPCRPFDKNRNGLNLGEGAALLVLEREKRDSAAAELAGYATFSDAYHPTAPSPDGGGLRKAVLKALEQAKISPAEIGFINSHGTATPTNDLVEGKVIRDLYGDIPVAATKAFTGHTLGAAGALEAVFCIRNLLDEKLPGTPGFREPDPETGISPVRETSSLSTEFAVSHSLAFGGNNSAAVFRRFP